MAGRRERSTAKPEQREPSARGDRTGDAVEYLGGFPPESLAFMRARAEMFRGFRTGRWVHGSGKRDGKGGKP